MCRHNCLEYMIIQLMIFAAVFLFIWELSLGTQIGTLVPNKTMDTPLTSANVSINQKMVSVFLAMISFRRCLMT